VHRLTLEELLSRSISKPNKAFPERMIALIVTFLFQIPLLLMISGGSDQLCQLIGQKRCQLLIAFLPLTSALSGNVALQASALTTHAIRHLQVTPTSWWGWLLEEIQTAGYLGVGMGLVTATLSLFASGFDLAFGLTIFTAQLVSILAAGLLGTVAPLVLNSIFGRDSWKWRGLLETTLQDIVGSYVMVVISYRILSIFNGGVASSDMCSAGMERL
jgi:Mg/Co/Ni transporter MgtE